MANIEGNIIHRGIAAKINSNGRYFFTQLFIDKQKKSRSDTKTFSAQGGISILKTVF